MQRTRMGRQVGAATAIIGVALILPTAAFAETMTSTGPLSEVTVSDTLNCDVQHSADASPAFHEETACGTFLAVDPGTATPGLFGPTVVPDGTVGQTGFTPVSQSSVLGTGTEEDPLRIETAVDAGATGLRVIQVDSYLIGVESYQTDITIENTGGTERTVILYRAGDCDLQNGGGDGFGSIDQPAGSVACRGTETVPDFLSESVGIHALIPGDRIAQWDPLTPGSGSYEAPIGDVWSQIGSLASFDSTCTCGTLSDNGAGLSWQATVAAGTRVTHSHLTTISPTGKRPLRTAIVPDTGTVETGMATGFTVTITNPNFTSVSLSSIFAALPPGLTYVGGSTSGATVADPANVGGRLTWAGPPGIEGGSTISLHFSATASGGAGPAVVRAGASAAPVAVASRSASVAVIDAALPPPPSPPVLPPVAPPVTPPVDSPPAIPPAPVVAPDIAAAPVATAVLGSVLSPSGVPAHAGEYEEVPRGARQIASPASGTRSGSPRAERPDPKASIPPQTYPARGRVHFNPHVPSVVAALARPGDIGFDVGLVAVHGALALLLILLIGFPAELFNKTVEENRELFARWFAGPARVAGKLGDAVRRLTADRGALLGAALVAAVLYSFLDPNFLNDARASAAQFLGLLAAIVTVTVVYELGASMFARWRYGEGGEFRVTPGALWIAVGCVLTSRILGFEPGYLFGIIAGVQFAAHVSDEDEGRAIAVAALGLLLVSFGAWLAFGAIDTAAGGAGAEFPILALDTFLAATFIAGLEGFVFGLVPLKFLDGKKVKQWNAPVWLGLYMVGMFWFVHVLMRPSDGYLNSSSTATTTGVLILLLGFGTFSVSLWYFVRWRARLGAERVAALTY